VTCVDSWWQWLCEEGCDMVVLRRRPRRGVPVSCCTDRERTCPGAWTGRQRHRSRPQADSCANPGQSQPRGGRHGLIRRRHCRGTGCQCHCGAPRAAAVRGGCTGRDPGPQTAGPGVRTPPRWRAGSAPDRAGLLSPTRGSEPVEPAAIGRRARPAGRGREHLL
jgi:hypothetical protein